MQKKPTSNVLRNEGKSTEECVDAEGVKRLQRRFSGNAVYVPDILPYLGDQCYLHNTHTRSHSSHLHMTAVTAEQEVIYIF